MELQSVRKPAGKIAERRPSPAREAQTEASRFPSAPNSSMQTFRFNETASDDGGLFPDEEPAFWPLLSSAPNSSNLALNSLESDLYAAEDSAELAVPGPTLEPPSSSDWYTPEDPAELASPGPTLAPPASSDWDAAEAPAELDAPGLLPAPPSISDWDAAEAPAELDAPMRSQTPAGNPKKPNIFTRALNFIKGIGKEGVRKARSLYHLQSRAVDALTTSKEGGAYKGMSLPKRIKWSLPRLPAVIYYNMILSEAKKKVHLMKISERRKREAELVAKYKADHKPVAGDLTGLTNFDPIANSPYHIKKGAVTKVAGAGSTVPMLARMAAMGLGILPGISSDASGGTASALESGASPMSGLGKVGLAGAEAKAGNVSATSAAATESAKDFLSMGAKAAQASLKFKGLTAASIVGGVASMASGFSDVVQGTVGFVTSRYASDNMKLQKELAERRYETAKSSDISAQTNKYIVKAAEQAGAAADIRGTGAVIQAVAGAFQLTGGAMTAAGVTALPGSVVAAAGTFLKIAGGLGTGYQMRMFRNSVVEAYFKEKYGKGLEEQISEQLANEQRAALADGENPDEDELRRRAKHTILKADDKSSGLRREAFMHITMNIAKIVVDAANLEEGGDGDSSRVLRGMGLVRVNGKFTYQGAAEKLGMDSGADYLTQLMEPVIERARDTFAKAADAERMKEVRDDETRRKYDRSVYRPPV